MKRSRLQVLVVIFVWLIMILSCRNNSNNPSLGVAVNESCSSEDMIDFEGQQEEKAFCIDRYEVSNKEYQECVAAGECTEPDKTTSVRRRDEVYYGNPDYDNYPVIRVTWDQANEYCKFVEKRLPTAAEWDIAAHAPDYYESWPSIEKITAYTDTQKIGDIGDVSPEKVHDLAGNVREWTDSEDKSSQRVVKGQSFYHNQHDLNSRLPYEPDWGIGFRCAVDSQ